MGATSYTPRHSTEGFVGNQKAMETPGPGSYTARDPRPSHNYAQIGFGTGSKRFSKPNPTGQTPYSGPAKWGTSRYTQDAGFNVSSQNDRTAWLASRADHTAGPGTYDTSPKKVPVTKIGQDPRFRAADRNERVGPGSYHSWAPQQVQAAPPSTTMERDSWLKGAVGGSRVVTGSAEYHVDRMHRMESPGPGSYGDYTSFSRAAAANRHQIPLEARALY